MKVILVSFPLKSEYIILFLSQYLMPITTTTTTIFLLLSFHLLPTLSQSPPLSPPPPPLNLPSLFKSKTTHTNWHLQGPLLNSLSGFSSGSGFLTIDGQPIPTIFGDIANPQQLEARIVLYLGGAMKTLEFKLALGEFSGGGWAGVQEESRMRYKVERNQVELSFGEKENASKIIIRHEQAVFHMLFLMAVILAMGKITYLFTYSVQYLNGMRPFLSFITIALLLGKFFAIQFKLLASIFTLMKWYHCIIPILVVLYLAFLMFCGISLFIDSIKLNKLQSKNFMLGASLIFLCQISCNSPTYKCLSTLIFLPQLHTRHKLVYNLIHPSQRVLTFFYLLSSLFLLESCRSNNFFRGEPSDGTFYIVLTLTLLQILAMLIPRYTKRRFSLSGDKIQQLCSICLENMREKEMAVTPCGHAFHKRCLRTWMNMNNMCPLDRIVLNMEDIRGELQGSEDEVIEK